MKFANHFAFLLMLAACSSATSTDSPSPVLEAVDPVAEEIPIEPPAVSPALQQLQARFVELGYEGVGMELESPAVLERLLKVFTSPGVSGRKIRSVYTGAAHDYDAAQESLTIGPDVKSAVAFIKKKVPVRSAAKKP